MPEIYRLVIPINRFEFPVTVMRSGEVGVICHSLSQAQTMKQRLMPKIQVKCPCHGWSDMWEGDCVDCYSESFDQQRS